MSEDRCVIIDADERNELGHPMHYRALNDEVRASMASGCGKVELMNVMGQRYIGSTLSNVRIDIRGTPGNDLGAFLNGAVIEVFGNAQDVTGNTMDAGRIIIHGSSGDITGLAARGGEILIRDDVGYRAGINMKEYEGVRPAIVIGGRARDYLGEYMAGGSIVVIGRGVPEDESPIGDCIGAGIHGGRLYVRGKVEEHQLGAGATITSLDEADIDDLTSLLDAYVEAFGEDPDVSVSDFVKIGPLGSRPFQGYYDKTLI